MVLQNRLSGKRRFVPLKGEERFRLLIQRLRDLLGGFAADGLRKRFPQRTGGNPGSLRRLCPCELLRLYNGFYIRSRGSRPLVLSAADFDSLV